MEVLPHDQLVIEMMAHKDLRGGLEGFRGCTTQSQQVLVQRHSIGWCQEKTNSQENNLSH